VPYERQYALRLPFGRQRPFDIVTPFTPISGLLVAPIAAYEMILAGWLIVKGFSTPAAAPEPAHTVATRLVATTERRLAV
jgi:hypothetical protein